MPAAPDDYYALLGIDAGATVEQVRRAWHRAALEWHPDRAGADATATFQLISIAYTVLSDPAARAAYDRRRGVRAPTTPAPADPPPVRRAPGVMIRRLSASLDQLLARGVARIADDGVIELFVDDAEVAEGGMITISMRVRVLCTSCPPDGPCTSCNGARTLEDVYAAWLALRPGATDGTILTPSARLPGMMRPVTFRVRL